jgi:cytidylate kinase
VRGIELAEAEQTVERLDRAHAEYTKRFYDADVHDPALYDVVLDSTAIDLDTCVELLMAAARSRAGAGRQR